MERLDAWRNAPGGRGDIPGEVEPGQFVQWNLEVCATLV
jgi:alpha 1,2-mannosyltransferase